jgi:hypothetical protein
MSDEKIRCFKNSAGASIDQGNVSYPIRIAATTIDGKVVEVLMAPTDADQFARRVLDLAAMSLKFWKPPTGT